MAKNDAVAILPRMGIRTKPGRKKLTESEFWRKYGIICTALAFLLAWSTLVWITAYREATIKVTKELTEEYEHEYELKMHAFEDAWIAENTPSEDEVMKDTMRKEADCIARLAGPYATKQMKQTLVWNVLARVDSPYYPDTVDEVVNQEGQWMFYSPTNPIRDDDVELVMEQLVLWHEGRYPAGFSNDLVYGAWSKNDYYLFDDWNKGFGTKVWRYGE